MIPKTTAFIFARAGSKGVKGKNIRPLAGKPMIAYAIEAALGSSYVERVVVSTDSAEIASISQNYGALTPFLRPSELAQDDSPEWLAWKHAMMATNELIGKESCPYFLSVPATCPLRVPNDIDRCIEALFQTQHADIAITTTPAHANPYFTMIKKTSEGWAALAAEPSEPIARRQDAPAIEEIVGVAYAARADFVMRNSRIWDGNVASVSIPQERALDIDTEYDFLLAELLVSHRKNI